MYQGRIDDDSNFTKQHLGKCSDVKGSDDKAARKGGTSEVLQRDPRAYPWSVMSEHPYHDDWEFPHSPSKKEYKTMYHPSEQVANILEDSLGEEGLAVVDSLCVVIISVLVPACLLAVVPPCPDILFV